MARDEDGSWYELADRIATDNVSLKRRHDRCKEMVQFAMASNPLVKQLLGAMKNSGCPLPIGLSCEDCEVPARAEVGVLTGHLRLGEPDEPAKIVICQNGNPSWSQVSSTVVHELVHAFDDCVGRVDWRKLKHSACAEVRGYNLSGECLTKRCVRRGAVRSLLGCWPRLTPEKAEKTVAEVLERCLGDRTPLGGPTPRIEQKNAFRGL